MFKKLFIFILSFSFLLLTGCVENRYGTPADEVPSDEIVTDEEETTDEKITEEEVVEEEAVDEEEPEVEKEEIAAEECVKEGENIVDLIDEPLSCCEGLEKIHVYDQTNLEKGKCIVPPHGVYVCATCGDGDCSLGENKCNCPEDCK